MKTRHWAVFILGRSELAEAALGNLKEQYPVTAHAPNFDFETGCREIKRCEESKRTLKNPFATRLTEFDTALKPVSITGQWYIAPVEFWFGRNQDFLSLLLLPLAGGPKAGKRFDADWRLISSASFPTSQGIVKGIRIYETATIETVRKKLLRHGCDWGDLVEASWSRMFCNDAFVNFKINHPTADQIKQTGATCLEKLVQ